MASLPGLDYASSEEESSPKPSAPPSAPPSTTHPFIVAAPDVSLEDPMRLQIMPAKASDNTISYNIPYDELARLPQGPANPYKSNTDGNALKRKNILTGYAEETALSEATFNTQHRTFQSLGYTRDPTVIGAYVGDLENARRYEGRDVVQMRPSKGESKAIRQKRQRKGDSSIVEGDGAYVGPWARYQDEDDALESEAVAAGEALASDEEYIDSTPIIPTGGAPLPSISGGLSASSDMTKVETTTFHGAEQYDYLGRTYMHVPQDLDIDLRKAPGTNKNFIPKKLLHTYTSHTKPITGLEFFPSSGHLLLSSSADSTIKIWDSHHTRPLLRTLNGHTKSISDITFSPSGTTFLSASYDRQMKLWDTEYGKCTGRFSTGKIPHVVRFYPSNPHEFVAGMSDKKIIQYDTRSGELIQEYDHHLGPVNTITFVDENRRFITTSDDKSLRAWEYNIPVPIKYIAEPYMYSMVRAALHPAGKYAAFQSADNQVVVYAAGDKFRQNRKKAFRGHNNAGYAINLAFSPDGQFLVSGDTAGYLCFWDWKTCKMWHKIQTNNTSAATTAVAWHPQETSKVASGGLDGEIRYWD